ncbi:uncharacterized protein RSE6_07073 [Rhynchosporium secalis]|uniref:C2H2-type domain-containing protein n=1 Tax=Rhynchosporium secalis TaxID=38038 RepID=A0A1E1MC24_RHYSE|nr:uncharacterized protein RSE6_07073 [Rhynchosporium secalis]
MAPRFGGDLGSEGGQDKQFGQQDPPMPQQGYFAAEKQKEPDLVMQRRQPRPWPKEPGCSEPPKDPHAWFPERVRDGLYCCPSCSYTCKQLFKMRRHVYVHLFQPDFCRICGWECSGPDEMRNHYLGCDESYSYGKPLPWKAPYFSSKMYLFPPDEERTPPTATNTEFLMCPYQRTDAGGDCRLNRIALPSNLERHIDAFHRTPDGTVPRFQDSQEPHRPQLQVPQSGFQTSAHPWKIGPRPDDSDTISEGLSDYQPSFGSVSQVTSAYERGQSDSMTEVSQVAILKEKDGLEALPIISSAHLSKAEVEEQDEDEDEVDPMDIMYAVAVFVAKQRAKATSQGKIGRWCR